MTNRFKLVQSESGDWFVVPTYITNEEFINDELEGKPTPYAYYVNLWTLEFENWDQV